MAYLSDSNVRILILFFGLVGLSCSPIWAVDYYINQDGTPHLYNAYLLLEILKGNESILEFASLNSHLVPNVTGHWILAFLLLLFEPATTTKIMATLTFGTFVASIGWLRFQVAGRQGLGTSLLLGAVLAFNWLWFLGFYNYVLAASSFSFSLGLWWRWRKGMNLIRSASLLLLLLFTFFSHLIGFLVLAASILFLLLSNIKTISKRSAAWTTAAVVATAPLFLNYLFVSRTGGGVFPRWNHLGNPFSISDFLMHLVADPFLLISRKAVPFVEFTTPAFAIFSSSLWLAITIGILILFSSQYFKTGRPDVLTEMKGWLILALILGVVGVFGPDDFGKSHGGILRERVLILGCTCLVPLFRLGPNRSMNLAARVCLIFVILFQSLVLWDYSLRTDLVGKRFFAAKDRIGTNDSVGSIVFIGDGDRFESRPLVNITTFLGIGKDAPIWDNYELGYYLFPVVAKSPEEANFVSAFRDASSVDLYDPSLNIAEERNKLEAVLTTNHQRIAVLLVWNEQPGFAELRQKWFQNEPYFESGELKLFRHR